ncbi:MAG: hypothetical protein LBE84_04680 [Planctomycetota bacterium]|jgi:hypothetical protein|nr:hypothetical protein [Planctomycetota bacterium]
MNPFENNQGVNKIVGIDVPGRPKTVLLCLVKPGDNGEEYFVLAEREGQSNLRWRSLVKDNAIKRLKDEYRDRIVESQDVDEFDVESIFLCTAEVSKA